WGNPWPVDRVQWHLSQAYDWSSLAVRSPLWFIWAQRGILSITPVALETSVALYRRALQQSQETIPEPFAEWLRPLRGRDLMCWCPLDQPCHADVLLEFANREPQR